MRDPARGKARRRRGVPVVRAARGRGGAPRAGGFCRAAPGSALRRARDGQGEGLGVVAMDHLPYPACPALQPNLYGPWFTDAEVWRPYVREVARRHALPVPGAVSVGIPGSHPVFMTDRGYVVKFFAPHWPHDHAAEAAVHRALGGASFPGDPATRSGYRGGWPGAICSHPPEDAGPGRIWFSRPSRAGAWGSCATG